uniref:Protein kinase domain-containing protein n=1 Tax=Oryza brachyantha TaxID=4533 RepID=J3NA24_ORYBR
MAVWGGLGQAATVAQLVGADVGGMISKIIQAAATARQNKKECDQLARRVLMIADLLPHLQDPEVMRRPEVRRPLTGLDDTLREAHELVTCCHGRSATYRFVMAGRLAERFRDVQSRIDSYLLVFPFISHIDITRRLDRIYNVLFQMTQTEHLHPQAHTQPGHFHLPTPRLIMCSWYNTVHRSMLNSLNRIIHSKGSKGKVSQEVVFYGDGAEEFTLKELIAATNKFAEQIGRGSFGNVYKGVLADGREVAIKSLGKASRHGWRSLLRELDFLSRLRHKHIVHLHGSCVARQKRSLLSLRRKDVKQEEMLLVYEYMKNGSLAYNLHGHPSSSSSPVMSSWKTRVQILLGVSRAVEYLHDHAVVIHRDIKPSNILLDASWAPRLTDFGVAVNCDEARRRNIPVYGTPGYMDPELFITNLPSLSSDVYSFGVVMLEVLTGKKTIFHRRRGEDDDEGSDIPTSLVAFSLPIIEDGELGKMLDRRPAAPEQPMARQLEALGMVAETAARCVRLQRKDRPAISEVVAILEAALKLILCDE